MDKRGLKLAEGTAFARLLAVMCNERNLEMNINEKIKEAEISKSMYYKLMADASFSEAVKNVTDKKLGRWGSDVLMKVYLDAMDPRKANWKQQEAILKLAGYIDKEDKMTVMHQYDKSQLLSIIDKKLNNITNPELLKLLDDRVIEAEIIDVEEEVIDGDITDHDIF